MTILCFTVAIHYAYAQSDNALGVRVIPNKIMENTEGIIQVYANSDSIIKIDKLIATSSDSSVIQILGIEQEAGGYTTDVKIQAVNAGDAKIALAAPGFLSNEFQITVSKNTGAATTLLIKATPGTFLYNGPKLGYVTVELANEAGFPTYANTDIPITITSSDSGVVNIITSQITIPQGSYYTVGKFEAKQEGTALISAVSPSMSTTSASVIVNAQDPTQTIQVYVYPQTINAYKAATAYVAVQLHDSSGNPVIAKQDIPIKVKITNSSGTESINTSEQKTLIQADQPLIIKKDSYWAYIPVSVNAGLNGKYDISISAKGYTISSPAQITTLTSNSLFDDKFAQVDILPILATGQKELIGVLHLQDSSANPILAKQNLQVHVDSSDPTALSVDDVQLQYGSQAALVFGIVGNVAKSVTLNVVSESPQTITPAITSVLPSSFSLMADPLVPKVLSHTDFPLAIYLTKNSVLDSFASSTTLSISPKEFIQTEQSQISKDQSIILVKSLLLKEETGSVSITTQDYSTSIPIEGLSTKPKMLSMDYPAKILANVASSFSIELLDDQQLPVSTDTDMEIKIVSSDPSVITTPDVVIVKKGTYYSTFEVQAKNSGSAELSVLGNELPMSKYTLSVTSLASELTINTADFENSGASFVATATVRYNTIPLSGINIIWTAQGAQIQNQDTTTDENGNAKISLIAQDPSKISIQATAQGGMYGQPSGSKDISVLAPLSKGGGNGDAQTGSQFTISGINPLFIMIPVAGGAVVFILKKKNLLDGVGEKIGFTEKFAEIREKIMELKER